MRCGMWATTKLEKLAEVCRGVAPRHGQEVLRRLSKGLLPRKELKDWPLPHDASSAEDTPQAQPVAATAAAPSAAPGRWGGAPAGEGRRSRPEGVREACG